MGWLITEGARRRDVIRRILSTERCGGTVWTPIANAVRGHVLWVVWNLQDTGVEEKPATRFIACYLLGTDGRGNWGYKDMEESMHPYYYSCPLRFLGLAPESNATWREKVREYHEVRKRQPWLKPGAAVRFVTGCRAAGVLVERGVVVSVRPLVVDVGFCKVRSSRAMLLEGCDG